VRPFAYERAESAAAAVAAGGTYLGGGTNLVDLMKLGVAEPERLVDVSRLPGAVEPEGDGVRIGASVRNADVAAHPLVRERAPLVARALRCGASPQLRNVATIGGNLLQRTRCPYFQDVTKRCNKRDPGDGCPAIEGHHRDLAILGHSDQCVATHPGDLAVALAALGATVHVLGPTGERAIPMPGLHRLPGLAPERDTVLEPGELITAVSVPALAGRGKYRKVRDRAQFSFAVVSVAAQLDVRDGAIADVRIALGGVAHAPWRAERAEAQLRGNRPTEEAFAAAAEAELAQADPLRDNAFKVRLARNLIVRTLVELAG
jgi:xanthine dehydrogenase YagS FAD-binding subunit